MTILELQNVEFLKLTFSAHDSIESSLSSQMHSKKVYCLFSNVSYHGAVELGRVEIELVPVEWYKAAYAKMIRLSLVLKILKQIDGQLINSSDNSVITVGYAINHLSRCSVLEISLQTL